MEIGGTHWPEATQKGFKKLRYQIMLVVLWLCGESLGGALGYIILGESNSFCLAYIPALLGTASGAGIAFLVMRLLPKPEAPSPPTEIETQPGETPILRKFGRSGWLPTVVILLSISCTGIGLGGALLAGMRSFIRQTHVNDLVIVTEIGSDGRVARPATEIAAKTETLYVSFYLEAPEGAELPVTVDWIADDQLVYSFSENHRRGPVVTKLARKDMGLSEFPKGKSIIQVRVGELRLATTSFTIK